MRIYTYWWVCNCIICAAIIIVAIELTFQVDQHDIVITIDRWFKKIDGQEL